MSAECVLRGEKNTHTHISKLIYPFVFKIKDKKKYKRYIFLSGVSLQKKVRICFDSKSCDHTNMQNYEELIFFSNLYFMNF